MSDEDILSKAVGQAIAGGWDCMSYCGYRSGFELPDPVVAVMAEIRELDGGVETYTNRLDTPSVYGLIFNHPFAKALWGEDPIDPHGPPIGTMIHSLDIESGDSETFPYTEDDRATDFLLNPGMFHPAWCHHLQQMVIADDPIKYLGEHL